MTNLIEPEALIVASILYGVAIIAMVLCGSVFLLLIRGWCMSSLRGKNNTRNFEFEDLDNIYNKGLISKEEHKTIERIVTGGQL